MSVDTTSYINSMQTSNATSAKSPAQSTLDKDGFLKLMSAQMKNQDPQGSQDPTQYFQSISQMTMVEQLTNLVRSSESSLKGQQAANATAMIGRNVTYNDNNGQAQTGTLESVQIGKTKTTVTINGIAGIDPATLTEIQ